MRLVLISDTHMAHEKLVVPDGDILIHAGDATWSGGINQVGPFAQWYRSLPHRHKIYVPGNHDRLFDGADRGLASTLLPGNITLLIDDLVVVEGLAIYGSPWTPRFGLGWAFNADRGESIRRYWDMIPAVTDVLVTHGPPMGILDSIPRMLPGGIPDKELHVGCEELRLKVDSMPNLKLHVFGHIHESPGVSGKFVNASMLNMDYETVRQPIVVDL